MPCFTDDMYFKEYVWILCMCSWLWCSNEEPSCCEAVVVNTCMSLLIHLCTKLIQLKCHHYSYYICMPRCISLLCCVIPFPSVFASASSLIRIGSMQMSVCTSGVNMVCWVGSMLMCVGVCQMLMPWRLVAHVLTLSELRHIYILTWVSQWYAHWCIIQVFP